MRKIIRYSAWFGMQDRYRWRQLTFAMTTMKRFILPYLDAELVVYTLQRHQPDLARMAEYLELPFQIVAIDADADRWREVSDFANSIQHCSEVDRICIVRMLTDFHLLPPDSCRLLVDTDFYFLRPPDELLQFCWAGGEAGTKVLFATDNYTFGGHHYELPFFSGPILNGLIGALYCMAPGVHLSQGAIQGCLRLIDHWPPVRERYKPIYQFVHACEQQAAAIMLAPFGGRALPRDRYSHVRAFSTTVAVHGIDPVHIYPMLPPDVMETGLNAPGAAESVSEAAIS